MPGKIEIVRALRDFKIAYQNLNSVWVEDCETDLNDTEAIRLYPFHVGFDDLAVVKWCDESIHELCGELPEESDIIISIGSETPKAIPFNREVLIAFLQPVTGYSKEFLNTLTNAELWLEYRG